MSGFSNLPSTTWGIFFVTLVVNIGNYMTPFMSIFLSSKLGLSPETTGIFVSIAGMAFLPGSLIGGKLADVWGKKQVFILFQTLAAITTLVNAFVLDAFISPCLFVVNAMFVAATIPVYNSTIFDVSDESNLKASLSLFFVGMNVGNLFSSFIGSIMFSKHYQLLFCIEAVLKVVSIVIFFLFVNYHGAKTQLKSNSTCKDDEDKMEKASLFGVLLKKPILILFSVSCVFFSIVLSQNNYALPLHLNSVFGNEVGTKYYGIVLGINAFTIIVMTGLIARFTSNWNKLDLVLIASIIICVGFGMLYFGNALWVYAVSTVLWSIADILNTPNSSAYFAEYAPPSMRGRFAAWIKIVTGAGYAIGPVCIGYVIENYGTRVTWPILAILAVICGILLCFVRALDKKAKQINKNNLNP